MRRINKHQRTGTEMGSSMSQTLERLGGGMGGRSRPKAKTNTSTVSKADSGASGVQEQKKKKKGFLDRLRRA